MTCEAIMLALSPLSHIHTHATQPVDQHPLAILKRFYLYCLAVWCQKHKGKALPKSEFFRVFWPAWQKAMVEWNIKAGFRVTGLWPIDENAIPDEKYTGDVMYSESNVDSTSESDTFESDYDDNDTNDCKLDMRIECSNWLFN